MKMSASHQSGSLIVRWAVTFCLVTLSAFLGFLAIAADPATGNIGPSGPTLNWTGTGSGTPPTGGGEDACEEGNSCDSFKLRITGTPADWAAAGKVVHVQI